MRSRYTPTSRRCHHVRVILTLTLCLSAWLGVSATDFGTAERFGRRQGLMSNYVTDIAQDRRGIIWIASEAGLHRFDGHSFTRYSDDIPGMAGNTLTSIRYDEEKDRLWIGTKSGLSCLNLLTGSFIDPALPQEALTYNISDIAPASDGGVWIVNHYTDRKSVV